MSMNYERRSGTRDLTIGMNKFLLLIMCVVTAQCACLFQSDIKKQKRQSVYTPEPRLHECSFLDYEVLDYATRPLLMSLQQQVPPLQCRKITKSNIRI